MSRKLLIFSITIVCFALSINVFAQETQDEKAVRDILRKEFEGIIKGDPDQIMSCYAADVFVGYWAGLSNASMFLLKGEQHNLSIDPEDWIVRINSPEELREYAENFRNRPELIKKYPEWKHSSEVRSVNVKGDNAIAVTRHWGSWPDKESAELVRYEHRSVWMLTKIQRQWKITNWIGGVSRGQLVRKTPRE